MKESELKVATIIPIVKGLPKATLSYFTKENLKVGTFVKIPIRGSTALGIISNISDVRDSKTDIKQANFSLKKLHSSKDAVSQLTPAFIRAAQKTAQYYATTIGNILGVLIPKLLLENPTLINSSNNLEFSNPRKEPLLIQLNNVERFQEYRSLIRGSFARGQSVLFITPTHEEALQAYDTFSTGIEQFTYLASNKSEKVMKEIIKQAHQNEHPVLFISTTAFISFNRTDLETIILERENSRSYRTMSRPYINIKVFLEYYAREANKTLIMGDSVLSLETLWKEKQGKYAELSPLKWRTSQDSRSILVDMAKKATTDENNRTEFEILSLELRNMIKKAILEKRKVFLFGARKGLAPSTACSDCGFVLSCENCSAPLVLHNASKSDRIYICHSCGARRSAETRCDHCQSWNLTSLGIGIDRIEQEISKLFPDIPTFVLDKDHAPTPAKAQKIMKKFASEKGGILIGTELAFLYLKKIPYVGLVSLDSLFSIPDFSISEKIFYLITRLVEISEVEIVMQTRNIGKEIIQFAKSGSILDFYRSEIEEREGLKYPPFSIFIKVTSEGTPKELEKKSIFLKEQFMNHNPVFMKGKKIKTNHLNLSMILRIERNSWPDKTVGEKLLLLPPDFLIKVDPEGIL
jgi:primosomal protein N'